VEDDAGDGVGEQHAAEELAGAEDVLLTGDVVEGARAHTDSQGADGPDGVLALTCPEVGHLSTPSVEWAIEPLDDRPFIKRHGSQDGQQSRKFLLARAALVVGEERENAHLDRVASFRAVELHESTHTVTKLGA